MAAFILFGNFCVAGGTRRSTPKKTAANGTPINIWHAYYDTTVSSTTGPLQAQLRIYSSAGAPLLPDNTIVFAIARAHVPQRSAVLLEAQAVFPYPGDPSSDSYEDTIPDFPATFFIGAGPSRTSNNSHETAPDGHSRAFTLELSDYVRDALNTSLVQCFYDHISPRWTNTPLPYQPRTALVYGLCCGYTINACLSVRVESITFNVGGAAPTGTSDDSSSSQTPATPNAKRRRFQAYAAASSSPTPSPQAASSSPATKLASTSALPSASPSGSISDPQNEGTVPPQAATQATMTYTPASHVGQGLLSTSALAAGPFLASLRADGQNMPLTIPLSASSSSSQTPMQPVSSWAPSMPPVNDASSNANSETPVRASQDDNRGKRSLRSHSQAGKGSS